MSCFDLLKLVCPACGTEKVLHTKAGDCRMVEYSVADAPAAIVADVAERSPFTCDECGALFRLRVTVHTVVERC